MKKKKVDKSMFKLPPEELEAYCQFQRRHSVIENKKGKGSYKRKPKHRDVAQESGPLAQLVRAASS